MRTTPADLACKVFLTVKETEYQLDHFYVFYLFSYFIIAVIQINLKCLVIMDRFYKKKHKKSFCSNKGYRKQKPVKAMLSTSSL